MKRTGCVIVISPLLVFLVVCGTKHLSVKGEGEDGVREWLTAHAMPSSLKMTLWLMRRRAGAFRRAFSTWLAMQEAPATEKAMPSCAYTLKKGCAFSAHASAFGATSSCMGRNNINVGVCVQR